MIELLLKSSLAIGIALLFYKLVLQQESFFATNRLYLLGCLVLAFALPFISLPKLVEQQGYLSAVIEKKFSEEEVSKKAFLESNSGSVSAEVPVLTTPSEETKIDPVPATTEASVNFPPTEKVEESTTLPQETEKPEESRLPILSLQTWLMLLYFFGVAILFLSLLFQLSCVFFEIIRSRDKIKDGDYIIVNTATRKAPCSFFKYIFIYPDDYDFETYEQIIKHEKTHVRLGHSFDLLLAELAVIALWFNPLIWLFKKEIEKNNEYQTDSILVEKEQVRKDQYQLNLLQIAVPNKPLNITTNYNQSLIKQRIVMMNSKRSTPHAYWKYTFLVPLFLGMVLLINEPATGQETFETENLKEHSSEADLTVRTKTAVRERQNLIERRADEIRESRQTSEVLAVREVRNENVQQRIVQREEPVVRRQLSLSQRDAQVDMTKGVWYSSIKNGKVCIEFRGSNENSRWNMSDCFEKSAFQKKSADIFVMSNEAGTLELNGNLDAEVGQGKYEFKENASFRNLLNQKNISGITNNTMFHLFFGGMTSDYVNFLTKEYPNLDAEDLTAIAIHGVKQEQFKNFISLFQKYEGGKPKVDDIIGLKIHGITESYVQELQKMGFSNLSLEQIMSAKIHGISAEYAQKLKSAGFSNLSIDEIVTAKIHDVSPETIKEMRALGAENLDKIVEMQIHDVDASYVKELRAAGLGDLSLDDIISAKIHRLNTSSIKDIRALGFKDLDFDDLLSAQIHGIDGTYIKELQSEGLEGLSLDDIVSAKIHGLRASSVKEIKALGFKNLDFDDLLSARIHDINSAFVKDLKAAGFPDADMDDIVSAKIHGVDREFIEKARKNGYNLSSIDKYISLKIHGQTMESLKDQGK